MAKKKDRSPPEHRALKQILGRIGRRKTRKEKGKGAEEKLPKDQDTGDGSSQDE
jgi:hypothetical protein